MIGILKFGVKAGLAGLCVSAAWPLGYVIGTSILGYLTILLGGLRHVALAPPL